MSNVTQFLAVAVLRSEALTKGDTDTAELCARALVEGEDSAAFALAWAIGTCERLERQMGLAAACT